MPTPGWGQPTIWPLLGRKRALIPCIPRPKIHRCKRIAEDYLYWRKVFLVLIKKNSKYFVIVLKLKTLTGTHYFCRLTLRSIIWTRCTWCVFTELPAWHLRTEYKFVQNGHAVPTHGESMKIPSKKCQWKKTQMGKMLGLQWSSNLFQDVPLYSSHNISKGKKTTIIIILIIFIIIIIIIIIHTVTQHVGWIVVT